MSGENELFDGIQVLSPAEIAAQRSGGGIEEPTPAASSEEEPAEELLPEPGSVESDEAAIVPVTRTSDTTVENEEEDDDPNPKPPVEGSQEDPPAPGTARYQALIKDLINEDIFHGHSEEELEEMLADASIDTVRKLMNLTLDTQLRAEQDKWKSGFDGAKKRFLEIEDKFTDTDTAIQMAQRLEFFDNVTDETLEADTNLQKNIYFEYLMSKNFSQEEARGMVEEADGIDKLLDKAKQAMPALKQQAANFVAQSEAQKKKQIEEYTEAQQKQFQSLMDTVETKEQFIEGMKLNKTVRDKVKTNMTTAVHTTEDGRELTSLMYKQMRNPAEFQALMSYYDTLGLFDVDKEGNFSPKIDKLKRVAKTKAVTELDDVLKREEERNLGGGNAHVSQKTSGLLDLIERSQKGK
jgi:hypothetical protein